MSEPRPREGIKLTRDQQALILEWTDWRVRTIRRLVRRFGKWIEPEEIAGMVTVAVTECAARFNPSLGVPFGAYALKATACAVWKAAARTKRRNEMAYEAAAVGVELLLSDRRLIFGTDEERTAALQSAAEDMAMAIVLAGAYSQDSATGAEAVFVNAEERARMLNAVANLPERQRTVLELRYGPEKRTLEALADQMGCAPITVRRTHEAALREIRAALS